MKLVFSSNSSWSIYNFRRNLLKSIDELGFNIVIIAPDGLYLEKLKDLGYTTIPVVFNNSTRSLFANIKLIWDYFTLYKKVKPDIVLHNAIKPNIYGALVCRLLRIPVVNNISGLGSIFMSNGINSALGKALYRISQKKVHTVFFQNSTDYNLFIKYRLISKAQGKVIPGSGIDLNRFKPIKTDRTDNSIKFCFVGRLLGDKGIYEFIESAKRVKAENSSAEFYILGELYLNHPTAVSKEILDRWIDEKTIVFLGKTDHVEKVIGQFDCIVLPSYREGLSRVLLEASSMAIPAITSDVPGCNDVIVHGRNGLLCKVKDAEDLYQKMKYFISLSGMQRTEMGIYGRSKVENEFDEKFVIDCYLKTIDQILTHVHNKHQTAHLGRIIS